MRRTTAALLLAVLFLTQSGVLNYLHLSEHLGAPHQTVGRPGVSVATPVDDHDERTCAICSTLHMALSAAGHVPLLIFLGLFVAFLTLLTPLPVARQIPVWIDCRGPPRRQPLSS